MASTTHSKKIKKTKKIFFKILGNPDKIKDDLVTIDVCYDVTKGPFEEQIDVEQLKTFERKKKKAKRKLSNKWQTNKRKRITHEIIMMNNI